MQELEKWYTAEDTKQMCTHAQDKFLANGERIIDENNCENQVINGGVNTGNDDTENVNMDDHIISYGSSYATIV